MLSPRWMYLIGGEDKRRSYLNGVQLSSFSFWTSNLTTPELIQLETIILTWRLYRNFDYDTTQSLNYTQIPIGTFGNIWE